MRPPSQSEAGGSFVAAKGNVQKQWGNRRDDGVSQLKKKLFTSQNHDMAKEAHRSERLRKNFGQLTVYFKLVVLNNCYDKI